MITVLAYIHIRDVFFGSPQDLTYDSNRRIVTYLCSGTLTAIFILMSVCLSRYQIEHALENYVLLVQSTNFDTEKLLPFLRHLAIVTSILTIPHYRRIRRNLDLIEIKIDSDKKLKSSLIKALVKWIIILVLICFIGGAYAMFFFL